MVRSKNFWIRSPQFDSIWIIGPHYYSVVLAFLLYPLIKDIEPIPLWIWFGLVLCIDVSHVYSTLYRVYWDKKEIQHYQLISWLVPLGVWVLGVILYSLSSLLFWRCLAYLAVFHFVRQQYGFYKIYSSNEVSKSGLYKFFNHYAIYFVTVLPIILWHLSGAKNFNWFIEEDFVYWSSSTGFSIVSYVLAFTVAAYIATEFKSTIQNSGINWAKNGIYTGTLLVWYLGIVHFNNDIIFTLTNVVSHGLPYLALIWNYKLRHQENYRPGILKMKSIVLFLGILFLLAYIEEFLWAALVWKDHLPAFFLNKSQMIELGPVSLGLIVPLLAVPQATHYILDAFIWKIRDSRRNQWMTETTGESQ